MLEYIKIVIKNLRSRRIRSFLTLLGIIIGIVSIILLYSFADSMEDLVAGQFDRMGTNKILVAAKAVSFAGVPSGTQGLTEDDTKTVRGVNGIDYAENMYSDSFPIEIKNKEMLMNVQGISTGHINDFYKEFDMQIEQGRTFSNGETGNSVVIGSNIPERFDLRLYPKNTITINDKNFRIIGIKKETGTQIEDNRIQIPIESIRDISNTNDEITGIVAVILPGVDIEKVSANIERRLERSIGDDNFIVITPEEIKKEAEKTIGVVKLIILAIAGVSLVVGGLGIMNSMYTSVLERTNEIGIMKAIGAKNNDILSMFLLEAGLLGLIGGILSLAISFLVIQAVNFILQQVGVLGNLVIRIKPEVAGLAILFAIVIGIVAGLFPAYRAMKLKPVDALRYE